MNISIKFEDITNFRGDVIIIPCDTELTYKKIGVVHQILETGDSDLVSELSAIGYCEIGHAVITQGYLLKVPHVIFMPISDHANPETNANFIDLHQSLRTAFTLAKLYGTKSIAISEIKLPTKKSVLIESISHKLRIDDKPHPLTSTEIEDIILSITKGSDYQSFKELTIYKPER